MGDARALELGAVVGVRVVEADDAGHAEVVQDGRVVLGEEGHLVGMLVLAAGLQMAFEGDDLWADLVHVAVHRVVKKLVNLQIGTSEVEPAELNCLGEPLECDRIAWAFIKLLVSCPLH